MSRALGLSFVGCLLVLAAGCSTVPPSEELQELEAHLQAEESQELRDIPNAARFHAEARQYRRVAEEARQDRREQRSQDYALLGLLRYETARAIYDQFSVADELGEINAEIEEINPQVREVMERRNQLAQDLRELDQEIRDAVREREEQRLARMQEERDGFSPAGQGGGDQHSELLDEANELIAEAEELREGALEFRADAYPETRGLFDRADTQLENARDIVRENPRAIQTANRQLGYAVQLFEESRERAQPVHEAYVEKMQPDNRIASLRDEAQMTFGREFVEDSSAGARLILARLFDEGDSDFRRDTDAVLDALVDLAEDYEEFTIHIEGYTRQAGGTTENRTLSQRRAQIVEDWLTDEGIEQGRISREGHGQSDLRYSDRPANNDRVEVTFSHEER